MNILRNSSVALLIAAGSIGSAQAYVITDFFDGSQGGTYALASDADFIYTSGGKYNNDGTYAFAGALPGGNVFGSGYTEWGSNFYRGSGSSILGFNKTSGASSLNLSVSGTSIHGLSTDGTDFYTVKGYGYSGGASAVEIWRINGGTGAASLFFDFATLPTTSTSGSSATTTGYIEDIAWVNNSLYAIDGAIGPGSGSSKIWKIDGATVGGVGLGTFDAFEDSPAGLHIEGIDWDGSNFWVHSNWDPVDEDGVDIAGLPTTHYYQQLGGFTTIDDPGDDGVSVPEPSTLMLLGLGLLGFGFAGRSRKA